MNCVRLIIQLVCLLQIECIISMPFFQVTIYFSPISGSFSRWVMLCSLLSTFAPCHLFKRKPLYKNLSEKGSGKKKRNRREFIWRKKFRTKDSSAKYAMGRAHVAVAAPGFRLSDCETDKKPEKAEEEEEEEIKTSH